VWGLGVRCPWLPDYAAKLYTAAKFTLDKNTTTNKPYAIVQIYQVIPL
jgi:hypothetical protein